MQSDTTTRALLAVIAICLVVLVIQGLGGSEGGTYRYQVTAVRAGTPLLIRTDMVTGKVWKSELRGGRGRWIAFSDPEDDPAVEEEASRPADTARVEREDAEDLDMNLEEDLSLESAAASAPPPRVNPSPARPPAAPRATPRPARPRAGAPASPANQFDQLAKAARRTDLPPDIRIWSLKLLGDNRDARSTDVLLEVLSDEDARVVAAAVGALGGKKEERVTEAVEKLRNHADPAVQAAAKAHLGGSS